MLTLDRYTDYIIGVQDKLNKLPKTKLDEVDSQCTLDLEELVKFQQWKNEAMLLGIIDQNVAQRIYAALGESISATNGGWAAGISTAEKFACYKLMSEIGGKLITMGTAS